MNNPNNQAEEKDNDYKLLTNRSTANTLKATFISYFLTLLIPTVGVGSFLYFMKDNLLNNSIKNASVSKNKNPNGIAGFILDNFNKADKNMDALNKSKSIQSPKTKLSKSSATYPRYKRKKKKNIIHKKTYTSRVYKPGETKMKMIIVEKK